MTWNFRLTDTVTLTAAGATSLAALLVAGFLAFEAPAQAAEEPGVRPAQRAGTIESQSALESRSPAYWHDKAEETRARARQMDNLTSRGVMEEAARVYDNLAENPELKRGSRPAK